MTPEQLRQKLQERRQGFAAELEKAEAEIRRLTALAAHASAHVVEIDYALEQLELPSAAPAKPKRAYKRKEPRAVEMPADDATQKGLPARSSEATTPSIIDGAGSTDDMPPFLRREKNGAAA